MSDIVEEILGDALPTGDVDLYIEPLEPGKYLVSGDVRLDDLSEHLGFEIEAEGIDTIGGVVFNRLRYFPPAGGQIQNSRPPLPGRRPRPKRGGGLFFLKNTRGGGAGEQPPKIGAA